jgi:AmiR/NasT family two-component response regulator
MADIAAIALLQERMIRKSHAVVQQLQGALSSRVVIEQAKGILVEQAHISVDAAFGRLRAHARANNLRLSDVAEQVIDGQLTAAALVSQGASVRER